MRACAWGLCIFTLFVCVKCQVTDDRVEQGYPAGFMSDCPGSTKPASIPRSQLKHLLFIVPGTWGRQKYNYWTAKNIAKNPAIDFNKKTIIVAIGYLDSANFVISRTFTSLYQARGYNVIQLEYQRFTTVHYYLASRLMRPVGKHTAEVLAQLTSSGLDPANLELIGFSLGGQTISYIAKNYQKLTGRNISRITALEPSGPCFRHLKEDDRLAPSDADFVEVIHTNIDGFGMAAKMGHVDFYINGGEFQPSELTLYPCSMTCSHFRVLGLWFSALKNPEKFIGVKCDGIQQARDSKCYDRKLVETNVMGPNVDVNKVGIFYIATEKWYPYYLGDNGLKSEFVAWKRITNINDGNATEIYV